MVRREVDEWVQLVTTVYGPNHMENHREFWNEIYEIMRWRNLLWVIGGDFNVVRSPVRGRVGIVLQRYARIQLSD